MKQCCSLDNRSWRARRSFSDSEFPTLNNEVRVGAISSYARLCGTQCSGELRLEARRLLCYDLSLLDSMESLAWRAQLVNLTARLPVICSCGSSWLPQIRMHRLSAGYRQRTSCRLQLSQTVISRSRTNRRSEHNRAWSRHESRTGNCLILPHPLKA